MSWTVSSGVCPLARTGAWLGMPGSRELAARKLVAMTLTARELATRKLTSRKLDVKKLSS